MLRGGGTEELSEDWTFPEHIYVLATMNSVDKAALPLDSALTRRFYRVEMRCDLRLLAQRMSVDLDELDEKAANARLNASERDALLPSEVAVLLLDRLNCRIAADMGEDFELGHALLWNVTTAGVAAQWDALIRAWDHSILPQLRERFAGRSASLQELLKADENSAAFRRRRPIGVSAEPDERESAIELAPLGALPLGEAQRVLRSLAI
jgi:5-methylcytosine-specific restriction protein B